MKKYFNIALLSTLFLINTTYSAQVIGSMLRRITLVTAAFSPTFGCYILEEIGENGEKSDTNLWRGTGRRIGYALIGSKKMAQEVLAGINFVRQSVDNEFSSTEKTDPETEDPFSNYPM